MFYRVLLHAEVPIRRSSNDDMYPPVESGENVMYSSAIEVSFLQWNKLELLSEKIKTHLVKCPLLDALLNCILWNDRSMESEE